MIDVEDITLGARIMIRGLSLKGKNRVREHGQVWIAISEMGGNVLFRSEKDGYLKWLSPDFEMESII